MASATSTPKSYTVTSSTWQHTIGVFFAALAALPAEIPSIDAIFHLGVTQSSEVAAVITGIATVGAAVWAFLQNNNIVTSIVAAIKK